LVRGLVEPAVGGLGGDVCVDLVSCAAGYGEKTVVRASASFCKGLTCIVGPNGSGKTTLLKTIARILEPLGGAIMIGGRDVRDYSIREFARIVGLHLSHVPAMPLYKVSEVVMLGRTPVMGLAPSKDDVEAVEHAMRIARVSHLADRYFNQLSDGEKRRVLIAMALARRPKVLILDEPTSFLDPFNSYLVFEVLSELGREIPVILSTHNIDLVMRFCDKIYYIDEGELRELRDPVELGSIYSGGSMILDPLTHSLEPVVGGGPQRTHIVGGCGSGVYYVRRYRPRGAISSGPLYPNDLDAMVLKRLGASVITTLSPDYYREALKLVEASERLVVLRVPGYCRPPEAEVLVEAARERGLDIYFYDFNLI